MKTNIRIRKQVLAVFLAFILLPSSFILSHAGIPEPETVIWGKVYNTAQGNRLEMSEGNVEWTLQAKGGKQKSYEFATEVECFECTEYTDGECTECKTHAYMLKVPQEAIIDVKGMDVADNAIPLTETYQQYDYVEAKVNGITARIIPKSPDWQYIRAGQLRRSSYYEADLEFVTVLSDTDGDGMPDWWEKEHGLDEFVNDADNDIDEDGWTNLAEFDNSTDPLTSNSAPLLLDDTLTIYESGFTQFFPDIADSDTSPENIRIRFPEIPEGIRIIFSGFETYPYDHIVRDGELVTLTDLEAGKVAIEHTAPGGNDLRLTLELEDGENTVSSASLRLEIFRPSLDDGTDSLYWADAYYYSEQRKKGGASSHVLPDRSGNKYNATSYASVNGMISGSEISLTYEGIASGKPTLAFDGTQWLELPDSAAAFPDGEITLFSVFNSQGRNDQAIASGPFFEIGIVGTSSSQNFGKIRVATEDTATYSGRSVKNEWLISSLQRKAGETQIDLNGLWSGGSVPYEEETRLGTDLALGARKERRWNFADEAWEFDFRQVFDGHLAEILVFDKQLSETRKWQTYAYLFSKWHGWRVSDFSDTSSSVSIRGVSGAAKLADFSGFSYGDFVSRYGSDHSYIFLGSQGDDQLVGGYEKDILIGGPGADEFMGFRGADIFVPNDRDTIWDFSTSEGDILYLSHLTKDISGPLDAYLHFEIQPHAEDLDAYTILRIDSDGDGSGYDDAAVTIKNVVLRDADLNQLWVDGNLCLGPISPSLTTEIRENASSLNDGSDITFSDSRHYHSADYAPADYEITLSELLRVIQLYNKGGYHCDTEGEDGYGTTYGHTNCRAHSADYNPVDWRIDLSELLRVIQIYNRHGYHEDSSGEDGFRIGKN